MIREMIPAHHGTSVVKYFYQLAQQRGQNPDEASQVHAALAESPGHVFEGLPERLTRDRDGPAGQGRVPGFVDVRRDQRPARPGQDRGVRGMDDVVDSGTGNPLVAAAALGAGDFTSVEKPSTAWTVLPHAGRGGPCSHPLRGLTKSSAPPD